MSRRAVSAASALLAALVITPAIHGFQNAGELKKIAELLLLGEGKNVADIGAGDGVFSVELARVVGLTGAVFSNEIDRSLIEKIKRRAEGSGRPNIRVVPGNERETGLPPASCDAILLRLVYHHLTNPGAMIASIRAALRPGGRILVIDFFPDGSAPVRGVPADRGGHGIIPEIVVKEMKAGGFELVERLDAWLATSDQFALVFTHPPPESPK